MNTNINPLLDLYNYDGSNLNDIINEEIPMFDQSNYYSYDILKDINFAGDLNILHLNVHSLYAKLGQLIHLINSLEESGYIMDILLLCETFMTNNNKSKCKIDGYSLKEYVMRENCTRGGVAIFVRNNIKTISRADLKLFKEGKIEGCFIEVITKDNFKKYCNWGNI
jgi:hypothetical protein